MNAICFFYVTFCSWRCRFDSKTSKNLQKLSKTPKNAKIVDFGCFGSILIDFGVILVDFEGQKPPKHTFTPQKTRFFRCFWQFLTGFGRFLVKITRLRHKTDIEKQIAFMDYVLHVSLWSLASITYQVIATLIIITTKTCSENICWMTNRICLTEMFDGIHSCSNTWSFRVRLREVSV